MEAIKRVLVWEWQVRAFHWALVVLFATSWLTAEIGALDWHMRSGFAILALVGFRLVWGLVGGDAARFANFIKSPRAAFAHLRGFRRIELDREPGHNAAGGWMVLVLLGALCVQLGTGLFANDDISSEGPLSHLVRRATWKTLTAVHGLNFNLLLALVVLHICAVIGYRVIKKQDLLRPMITGWKMLPPGIAPSKPGSALLALVIISLAGLGAWFLSQLGG